MSGTWGDGQPCIEKWTSMHIFPMSSSVAVRKRGDWPSTGKVCCVEVGDVQSEALRCRCLDGAAPSRRDIRYIAVFLPETTSRWGG